MTVERGLSENTIVSYKRDLQNYLSFLMTHEQLTDISDVTRLHIIHYLKLLKEEGNRVKRLYGIYHRFVPFINFCFGKK
ncbi:site-specific integrase [Bacillus sp. OHL2]